MCPYTIISVGSRVVGNQYMRFVLVYNTNSYIEVPQESKDLTVTYSSVSHIKVIKANMLVYKLSKSEIHRK